MKNYTTPDIELLNALGGDVITASQGTEGPIVDMDESSWNW